ncbi:iron-hydroxamate ABC transporter substrate-binding protein [Paenibacillus sp. PCH8]|uniref:iron-hydroxamate ABC transporter substrate-binding protein n=1 Tax=Paenibacillus sp. PCH8 TaxID=2066524 RepID=UPI000CF84A03|nr:iron-hydroxamate ABC transporter substrate-binding protein [Paenibacillus sp. PCH8]PQP83073.1 iron-hydroxamate ABC transporter substrate-binding protein [Paenibacillus sp. PCH8]
MLKKNLMLVMSICLVLVLAACGSGTANNSSSASGDSASNTSTDNKDSGSASGEPRIASMSIHLTNDLLSLGITPVGSVIGGEAKAFLSHVADRLQNTTPLGPVKDPDMEALLALKPDVIYLDEEFSGDDIAKFEKIAPVHVFNLNKGTWRDHLKDIGKLVNREKEAEQYIQDYATETEEVKSLIHDTIGDGTVMAIRVTAKELRVFSTRRPMGPILYEDLGLTPAKGITDIDSTKPYQVVSREVLPDYDADAIFVVVNSDDEAQTMFKELESNPIWQGLKAVKAGHVYPIGAQPWLDYSSIGNKMALDEAKEMFSKK